MDRRVLIAAAALVAAASACYAPRLDPCSVRCSTTRTCPYGWSCGADDFCHDEDFSSCRSPDAAPQPDADLDAVAPDAVADANAAAADAAADAAP